MPNVVLVGFMGIGKTSVGKRLAVRLRMKFLDIDDLIEEEEGISIKEIFAQFGEPYFRKKEASICERISGYDNYVIATGGGVVLNPANMENLKKNGLVICLTATPEIIYQRTSKMGTRPLLQENPEQKIRELLEFRDPFYKKADWMLDTSCSSIGEVVEKIIEYLKERGIIVKDAPVAQLG